MTNALLISLTVALTVLGQVVLRWQLRVIPPPADAAAYPGFLISCLANPWVWATVMSAFAAMASWMVVMTRLPLNVAYPFTSASFAGVLVLSYVLLGERPTLMTVLGTGLIVAGIVVVGLGAAGRT